MQKLRLVIVFDYSILFLNGIWILNLLLKKYIKIIEDKLNVITASQDYAGFGNPTLRFREEILPITNPTLINPNSSQAHYQE